MNTDKQVSDIIEDIKKMLLDMNFNEVIIGNRLNYVNDNIYCIPNYIKSLGFLMEYAHSIDEAEKNWHGDGDSFPLTMGKEAILSGIKKEITETLSPTLADNRTDTCGE